MSPSPAIRQPASPPREAARFARPLRVLHVCESIKGGVATTVNAIIRRQVADGRVESVAAVCPAQHRQYLPDLPQGREFPFDWPARSPASVREQRRALKTAVAAVDPDVVHLHASISGLVGRGPLLRPFARPGGRPAVVYCPHAWAFVMDVPPWKRRAYAAAERWMLRRCDAVIAVSQSEIEAAAEAGLPTDRCRLVRNGLRDDAAPPEPVDLPPEARAAIDAGRRVFLFLGRYDHQKGLDLLLPAFAGDDAPGTLLCAGGSVVQAQDGVAFGPHAHDVGWVTAGQVTRLLEMADAMVMPSRWEGLPNVAMEAMRAGRALICSDVGGLPEAVEHGRTGLVLPSFTAANFREAVAGLSEETLAAMGHAGAGRFQEHFTDVRMHEETLAVYGTTLSQTAQTA